MCQDPACLVDLPNPLASLDIDELAQLQFALDPQASFRQRIGIMGGTFNPPHLGHLMIAEQVGQQLELDEVWFMPTATPPHQGGKATIDSQHRVNMTRLAISDNPLFRLQTYEVDRGGINYTVDTMRYFVETYHECSFYFIIGSDSVADLVSWRGVDELVQLVQLVGVRRPGEEVLEDLFPVLWVDSPLIDLSSTQIRLRTYLDQSIRYQVPEAVEAYIKAHRLYQAD